MKFERKISKWGGSTGLSLPLDLLKFLNLNVGDDVIIQDEHGKYGPYITIWKGAANDKNTETTE